MVGGCWRRRRRPVVAGRTYLPRVQRARTQADTRSGVRICHVPDGHPFRRARTQAGTRTGREAASRPASRATQNSKKNSQNSQNSKKSQTSREAASGPASRATQNSENYHKFNKIQTIP